MTSQVTNESSGAASISVHAPVDEVCLMEDRGRVTRKGTVAVAAGRHRLLVSGVSPAVVDKSLVVAAQEGSASIKVIDARVVREVVPETDAEQSRTEVGRLTEQVRVLEVESARRAAEIERLIQRFRGLTRTIQLGLSEIVVDASWAKETPAEDFTALEELRAQALDVLDARAPLEQAQEDNETERNTLQAQIHALRSPGHSRRASIEIDIEATTASDARLQIDYAVPGACWRPAHRAELLEDGQTLVRFETDACVWQNTGEDWDDVQLFLSTERASLGVEPPKLGSDVLQVQRKSQTVQIEAREQVIEVLSPGGGGRGGSGTPKLPGIDDGGTALNLRAPQRSTLPSDGRPHRIFLSSFETDVQLSLVAMPEINPCVLVSSSLENAGGRPLLAGPVDLIRQSGLVGRSKVLYVASGERFELGWGPEPELRIRRDVESSSETSRVLSSWRVKNHDIKLRVSNIGQNAHRIEVTERVPVSEIDKVKIEVDTAKTTGKQNADANGFVKWTLEVAPMAHEALELHYRVKKHENVEG